MLWLRYVLLFLAHISKNVGRKEEIWVLKFSLLNLPEYVIISLGLHLDSRISRADEFVLQQSNREKHARVIVIIVPNIGKPVVQGDQKVLPTKILKFY